MKFIDLFGGIGGFSLGMERSGHECAGYYEWDKYAVQTYNKNFKTDYKPADVTKLDTEEIPDFDCLCGGFPCQAFSIAGKRKSFDDPRGRLFFEIERIAKAKQPKYLFLENVAGILSAGVEIGTGYYQANKGKPKGEITSDRERIENEPRRGWTEITFNICQGFVLCEILLSICKLGHSFTEWEMLNSKNFGVPQNRERVFIIGHLGEGCPEAVFPIGQGSKDIIQVGKNKEGQEDVAWALRGRDYKDGTNFVYEKELIELTENAPDAQRIYASEGIAKTLKGIRTP